MSLILHQPNLPPTSSHPCGQSWHHTSNVDISLLLKPRERERERGSDDNSTTIHSSSNSVPVSPIRTRGRDRDRDQDKDQDNSYDSIPSPPQSVARVASTSSTTTTSVSRPQIQLNLHPLPSPSLALAPPPRTTSLTAASTPTTSSTGTITQSISTSTIVPAKRSSSHLGPPSNGHHAHPAKKQSKWSPYEDSKIISLRAEGMKWEDISRLLPGRSAISCRLHYQNYLERRSEWDEDRKDRLARLYERFKQEMWSKIAEEMAIPWRAAEAMHWQIGEHGMAGRAGVTPFSLTPTTSGSGHGPGGGGGAGASSRSAHGHGHSHGHSRHMSRSVMVEAGDSHLQPYPRVGAQQLPSLSELTAGIPAWHHPSTQIQPLLPGPGPGYSHAHSYAHTHAHTHSHSHHGDSRTTPGTPYSSGLPYPGQGMIPSPGSQRGTGADFFLRRP